MTYLPSLIKKINEFHRQAFASKLLKQAAPGDKYEDFEDVPEPEPDYSQYTDPKYQKVTKEEEPLPTSPNMTEESGADSLYYRIAGALEDFDNQDIANEVFVIAEEYRRAIQINGGFTKVLSDISKAPGVNDFVKDYGFVAKREAEMAESYLREMASNLKQLAATSGPQANEAEAVKQLGQAKQEAIGVMSRQEMSSQPTKFERADKTGITSGVTGPKDLGDKQLNKYEQDIASLTKAMDDPYVPENDKQHIPTLINLNRNIIYAMKDLKELQGVSSTIPDENYEAKGIALQNVETAFEHLTSLKEQRAKVMLDLKAFHQRKRVEEWAQKSIEAGARGRKDEQRWYEWKAQEAGIRLDPRVNKTPALEAIKELLRATGKLDDKKDFNSQTIEPRRLEALQDAFNLAKARMITKEDYDRERTEEKGKQQGRDYVPTGEAQRGGRREKVLKQMDFDKATFPGMLKKLRDLNNTATADSRKYIMRPKEGGDPALEPYIDAVSASIRKKRKGEQFQAVNALREAIKQTLVKDNSLKGYIQVLRMAPFFKTIEEKLYSFKDKQDESGVWNLSDEDKQNVAMLVSDITRLMEMYTKYYSSPGMKKFIQQPYYSLSNPAKSSTFFKGVINAMANIKKYVEENMLVQNEAPPTPQKRVELPATGPRIKLSPEAPLTEEGEELEPAKQQALKRMKLMTQLMQSAIRKI